MTSKNKENIHNIFNFITLLMVFVFFKRLSNVTYQKQGASICYLSKI